MKWKDLSLKERKQIYDSVRVNNPDATYFDIKEQFDSIPAYEDGKAGYTPEERAWVARRTVELGMEGKPAPQDSLYTIVDRAKVQNKPKKYDPTDSAIEQGKQVLSGLNKTVGTALTGASLATMGLWNAARLLNVGTGSSWRLWAAKNALTGANAGLAIEGTEVDGVSVHSFAPTQTKKKTKKKTEEDYDSEFSEVLRKDRNSKKYQQEISRTIEQAIFPDERTRELVENVDKTYGTNYKRAYSNIAYKDMTKRGSYVKWGNTDKDGYGQINIKNIKDNVLPTDINDYNIVLDNNIYMPGTANHELGHVADGLAGSRKIQDFDSGKEYITNTYLNYLANSNNTYSSAELRKMGLFDAAGSRSYLLNPTEAKSHMLTLKRSLKDSGKITNWSTPVDENMILEYMRNPTSNKMVKNQYDLYRNKNEYIDRLNKLIPMEILMPLGGAGFVGHELNKE